MGEAVNAIHQERDIKIWRILWFQKYTNDESDFSVYQMYIHFNSAVPLDYAIYKDS